MIPAWIANKYDMAIEDVIAYIFAIIIGIPIAILISFYICSITGALLVGLVHLL